jgi:hypothetical protein
VATCLRAAVNKREQQLYQEYLTQLFWLNYEYSNSTEHVELIYHDQTKLRPLEGLARPRALPRPPPYGAVERSARAWSPALQAGPVLIHQLHPSFAPRGWEGFLVQLVVTSLPWVSLLYDRADIELERVNFVTPEFLPMTHPTLPPPPPPPQPLPLLPQPMPWQSKYGREPTIQQYQDWARLQGRGPRTGGPFDRTIGWRSW